MRINSVMTGIKQCCLILMRMINLPERIFAEKMPEFYIYPREGTYLLWMDYKELGCEEAELEKWFLEKAKVSVYMGTVFQEEGRGCIRLNIASPRKLLKEAYDRMYAVYEEIKK